MRARGWEGTRADARRFPARSPGAPAARAQPPGPRGPPTSGSAPRERAAAGRHRRRPRPKEPETKRGRQLTSSRPSRPAASPGNVGGGGAGRGARRAGLGPGRGPAHPLPQAPPAPTGARHAAPRRTRARVSPRGAGEEGRRARGARDRVRPAAPSLPHPRRVGPGSAWGPVGLGPRPRWPRARARSGAAQERARSRVPGEGRGAEAQAKPRPPPLGRRSGGGGGGASRRISRRAWIGRDFRATWAGKRASCAPASCPAPRALGSAVRPRYPNRPGRGGVVEGAGRSGGWVLPGTWRELWTRFPDLLWPCLSPSAE